VRKALRSEKFLSRVAGTSVEAEQAEKLERLARYVSRPLVSVERLTLIAQGDVRYRLKVPYRDGTTHSLLEPLDFLARLAALVPRILSNLEQRAAEDQQPRSSFASRAPPQPSLL
jgi:hypothetical protein